MERNLLLAVVLSSLLYIGWYSYMGKKYPKPQRQQAPAADVQTPQASAAQPAGAKQQAAPAAQLPAAAPALAPADWRRTAVELKAGKSVFFFSPETGSIMSHVYQGPVAPVELVPGGGPGFFALNLPYAFALKARTADSAEFAASAPGGLLITKKFTLSPDGGLNTLKITFENKGRAPLALPVPELTVGPGLGTVKSEEKENSKHLRAVYTYRQEGRKHPTVQDLKDDPAADAPTWAGVDNRYFLAAMVGGGIEKTRPFRREQKVGEKMAPELVVPLQGGVLAAGQTLTWETSFYFGPKDYHRLQQLGGGLDRSVNFGFFAPLAKLANATLIRFHSMTGNYGLAIIMLSVLLQILLTPLSYKSFKAMALMKKIQPEMQQIQAKYKDNPTKMNQEVMALYQRHGTNPLGGCLPMLLQIPVFFALYTALSTSWNLHGAPFGLWIHDLSAKDPYYVLPLVMGGVMFLQQHMSPQTSDPTQAAMMKWMPVVMTFVFLSFPSGLVTYWLINSIWGFAQNMYLQKKMA